jgi:hypothetical protein
VFESLLIMLFGALPSVLQKTVAVNRKCSNPGSLCIIRMGIMFLDVVR